MAHTLDSKDARITAILDDRLFLGDMTAALNPTMLRARGITHVVNASNGAAPNKFSSEKTQIARAVNSTQRSDQLLDWPVKYINVDIDDSADADIAAQFDRVCHWIAKAFNRCSNPQDQSFETASAQTPAVLVHCMCGVSRSATLLLAYLVKHESFTLREAWDLVKGRRPIVQPNFAFCEALVYWEMQQSELSSGPARPSISALEICPEGARSLAAVAAPAHKALSRLSADSSRWRCIVL